MTEPAYEHNGRHVSRERFYAIACDPARSVAVEACAGAGKTWVLVSRILRALLAGAKPHEILAITFTKKAAGEMRQRLHEWLAAWSAVEPEQLHSELRARGVAAPTPELQQALHDLYAGLLGSGRPVQIRTFHSWFAALLSSAPLAVLEHLGLPSAYELLEDDKQAVSRVWRRFYMAIARDPGARRDYERSVAAYGRSQTQKALEGALSKRVEFALADANGVVEASVKPMGAQFPDFAECEEPIDLLAREDVRATLQAAARALGAASAPTFSAKGAELEAALSYGDLDRVTQALLTQAEEPRKFSDKLAGIDAVRTAQALVQRIGAARCQHEAWQHQQRMARLSRRLLDEFAALKREQGWIDMNDVERAALVLLADEMLSGWIQEKLDVQVKHLLIDEFQDTNPLQWQALHAWLSGYAGAGGRGPSVFLVGDPKQSIYRFRRAEPQVFAAAQRFVVDGLDGDRLACDHTHRNAPQVLGVVNQAMDAAQQAGEYQDYREHTTQSVSEGHAYALPQVPREAKPVVLSLQTGQWRDSLTVARDQPEEKLIALECRQAAAWIAAEIRNGTPPGELMVLARKRDRLAAMEAELRALHVPTQQPEKTDLSEAPEVRDIVALLDVLVSPSHDLSLAQVLKSPLFGLADDALADLAVRARAEREEGRPTSWFELLRAPEGLIAPLQTVGATLLRWKGLVDRWPPHDALQAIYEDGDVLARYARAMPSTMRRHALANLRALLDAALAVRGGRALTPYAFVRALKAGGVPGPAVAEANVVRLLTVHGAKGLEADTVLLLDTDNAAGRAETMGVICDWPGEAPAPVRLSFLASENRPPACNADALAAERVARQREELNALYVALTRARRRLVLSSVQPASSGSGASWWQRVSPLCEPLAAEAPVDDGMPVQPEGEFLLNTVPVPPRQHSLLSGLDKIEPESPAARFGRAMHFLLEHGAQGGELGSSLLCRVARDFGLDDATLRDAGAMARRIAGGEGAWAWDPRVIDWQGNEVELLHRGERLRLDRLVRRRDTGEWWVLDYKSLAAPERQDQLLAQMRRYCEAVAQANPGAVVRAAFLTGQGRLVALD
ncbi:UvrD-helicase domain-containing protein [Ramlibacter sp.]|uniref:UvrD-helicase domain-containing protein n=1 Tax=Ramlibacter sp. TaxID=1917967 RepID=UPI001854341F|nr:UvrD-helicase domain-containing protein [Ramlibacter sp.]MBA2673708.1 UvrD-helicase domain-containing protein [Ramlibacter sp.]